MMQLLIFILLSVVALFGDLALALAKGCDCSVDNCIGGETTCFVNVPTNPTLQGRATHEYQTCDDATYTNLKNVTGVTTTTITNSTDDLLAATNDCKLLFSNFQGRSNLLRASDLNDQTGIPVAHHGGCYLWIGVGKDEHVTPSDSFWIGNKDLHQVVAHSIMSYGGDAPDSTMAVCGTLPNCEFNGNTTVPTTPGLSWCVGGSHVWDLWASQHQSQSVAEADLPSSTSQPLETAAAERSERAQIAPRAGGWYARCNNGVSLAECTTYQDLYCDSNGVLSADNVRCRLNCECVATPNQHCYIGPSGYWSCYGKQKEKVSNGTQVTQS